MSTYHNCLVCGSARCFGARSGISEFQQLTQIFDKELEPIGTTEVTHGIRHSSFLMGKILQCLQLVFIKI